MYSLGWGSEETAIRKEIADAAIYAQAFLDEALSLGRLADVVRMSPHHFHKLFLREVGETPAGYVQRLRLEKAAFRLLIHDDPIVSIAMDCGYLNHETLSRAFRRRFGLSPREYRRQQRPAVDSRRNVDRPKNSTESFALSRTRTVRLRPLPIAYIRVTGPYERVDTELWTILNDWADQHGFPDERMLIGIGHDAPGVTAPEHLRFDACIQVPTDVTGDDRIRIGVLPSLLCAVTTHVGAYRTLPTAYPEIFNRATSLKGYEVVGPPAIEVYRDSSVVAERTISSTDIHLPLRRGVAG